MTSETLAYKLSQYQTALGRLQEAVEAENAPDNFVADSTIQRFEFSAELAWKLLKAYLEVGGVVNISSPIDAIKEANAAGLLATNGDDWAKMIRSRNFTSHTYDAQNTVAAYELIKTSYYPLLKQLNATLSAKIP